MTTPLIHSVLFKIRGIYQTPKALKSRAVQPLRVDSFDTLVGGRFGHCLRSELPGPFCFMETQKETKNGC